MADGARSPRAGYSALAACAVAVSLLLAGCASGPRSGGGALGGRDGPGSNIPADLDRVPDAEPRVEPIRNGGGTSKPYTVLGRAYQPITDDRPFRESGIASWYGRKFHSASTASGEPYDMYAMTAAHKTLPLPSYVRVRNPANGREVIVRVNDRGPFVDGRIIDLSYTAALKLDLLRGVAPVEIERITNEDIRTGAWRRDAGTAYASAAPPAPTARSTAAPSSTAAAATGFWVQLGAFRERDGAETLLGEAARGLPSLAPQLRVFSEAGTHRLQAGPFPSRTAAGEAVTQLRESLRIAPMVVERR